MKSIKLIHYSNNVKVAPLWNPYRTGRARVYAEKLKSAFLEEGANFYNLKPADVHFMLATAILSVKEMVTQKEWNEMRIKEFQALLFMIMKEQMNDYATYLQSKFHGR